MKKINLLLVIVLISAFSSMSQITDNVNQKQVLTKFEQLGGNRSAVNVLVFRDQLPWGINVVVPLLQGLGANVTTATSGEMGSIDLAQYCLVVFESNQPETFYVIYNANLAKFTSYVNNGGILEFHACVFSSVRENIGSTPLPGGAATFGSPYLDSYNYIVNASHSIVNGLSDPLEGGFASHDAFMDLPAGTDIITRNSSSLPTTIEYSLGSGRVIATGMTWEFGYTYGWNFGPMLPQCLAYTTSFCNAPQEVPINNWALFIGIGLILVFAVVKFRKMV